MTQRIDRINEQLRQEIGDILSKEVADPRIGFVTITSVETAPDLHHARVWVSVIGQPAERDLAVAALGRAMPFVRRELGRRLRLRRIPEFHVRLDDSAERGTRVLHLLHELETGKTADEIGTLPDSLPTPVRRLPHEGDSPEPATPPDPEPPATPRAVRTRRDRPPSGARPPGRRRSQGPKRA